MEKISKINKELGLEGIDQAIPEFKRIERFKAIDDWFIQTEANSNSLLSICGHAGIFYPGSRRIPWEDSEKEKVQNDDKQDGKEGPFDLV